MVKRTYSLVANGVFLEQIKAGWGQLKAVKSKVN